MFSDWLTQAIFEDDERDTTEVPKQVLNVVLDYLFIFITVSSLYLVSLINSLLNLYIIMYRSAHCVLSQFSN